MSAEIHVLHADAGAVDGLVKRAKDDAGAPFEKDALVLLESLDPPNYQRARARLKDAGIRVTDLDVELAKRAAARVPAAGEGHANLQGKPLQLATPEPWGEPVDGAALLNGLASTILRYLIMSVEQAVAVALWVLFTHVFDAFDVSPKLNVKSAQKRSGKTRLAEVLERIVARPLLISGIRPSALLRLIEQHAPTVLLDEVDALMKQSPEMAEALRGLINSGFSRAAARVVMNVPTPDGGWEPRAFSTWAPLFLSGIGNLPDTVRDRSIIIEMQRKLRSDKVKRLRLRDGDDLRVLSRMATRWAQDNIETLHHAEPEIPAGLNDRAADAWEPLLAIAEAAGGEWPKRAREAALGLSGDGAVEDNDAGTMLLADIKAALEANHTDRLSSEALVNYLVALEDRPWAEWGKQPRPITKNCVAKLLKPFKIKSGTIRLADGSTRKGYKLEQFVDLFERYLPNPPNRTVTTSQPAENPASPGVSNPSQPDPCDGSESAGNPKESATCDVVTDEKGGSAENAGIEPDENWPELPLILDRVAHPRTVAGVPDLPWDDEL